MLKKHVRNYTVKISTFFIVKKIERRDTRCREDKLTPLVNIPVKNFIDSLVVKMSRAGSVTILPKAGFLYHEYIVFNVKYQKLYTFLLFLI